MPAPVISVFGSAAPQSGSPLYQLAYDTGRLLAEGGYTPATGGYGGTMAGVSEGAASAGGHVIGVTCDQIEQHHTVQPNAWVKEEIRYASLRDRLYHLASQNEGIIVLPGGLGTMAELSLAWNLMQVQEIAQRPFIVVGPMWRHMLELFLPDGHVTPQNMALIGFAEDAATAVALLNRKK